MRGAWALRRRRFDVAIDLQCLAVSGFVAALSGARERLGFDLGRIREKPAAFFHTRRLAGGRWDAPVIEQNLAFADALGAPPAPLEFRLEPRPADLDAAARLAPAGPYAAFVVGAGKDANRPFPETLAAAARALERDGLATVVLGGGGARDEAEAAAVGGTSLCGRTSLRETLAVLARAAVAIGGDTGPLHVAAAAGTPVVALFGGASPGRTGPVGAPARVIWKRWRCAPCYLRRCPIGRECLAAIAGDEVAAAARDLLSRDGGREAT